MIITGSGSLVAGADLVDGGHAVLQAHAARPVVDRVRPARQRPPQHQALPLARIQPPPAAWAQPQPLLRYRVFQRKQVPDSTRVECSGLWAPVKSDCSYNGGNAFESLERATVARQQHLHYRWLASTHRPPGWAQKHLFK